MTAYLTTAEVAKVLRESRENVSRRCKRGQLQAVRVGRRYLISQASLDALLTPTPVPDVSVAEPVFLTTRQKKQATRRAS